MDATHAQWQSMIQRCSNRKLMSSNFYGGRGIKVCERWLKFENFLADLGPRPYGMQLLLDPDPDGNFEPGNVRWATSAELAERKKRRTACLAG